MGTLILVPFVYGSIRAFIANKMKKLLSIFTLMLLPMLASADAIEIDGIYYNLESKSNQAEVTRNPNLYKGDVVIPESVTYKDAVYSVTSIGEYAFVNCSDLTSITIPSSVISIYREAFKGCSGLTSIKIPNSVTSIGFGVFCYCIGLTSITIPNSVIEIGNYVFSQCSGLTSITIPNSVTSISEGAFFECKGLTSVAIPNSVTSIGLGAFDGCRGLTSITIPNSVAQIGDYAFNNCSGLTSITIPNSVTSIGLGAFSGCSGLTSIAIPNSVAQIGDYAFHYCSGLTSITIPNSVSIIGEGTFAECIGLTSVTVGSEVNSIDIFAFYRCKKLLDLYCYSGNVPKTESETFRNTNIEEVTLHVPAASVSAYQAVEPWKNFKEIVALTDLDEYHPLLEEGKNWQYDYNNGVNQYMKTLSIGGDTIIGDQTYKKIIDVASQGVEMFLREEGKKVYCYYPNQNSETLLYDFGKNAGEIISREIKNGDTWIRKVIAVDTIMVKANPFRCLTVHEYFIPEGMSEEEYFAGEYGYDCGIWIEGIGSLKYLDTPIGYDGNYYSFYECWIGDTSYNQKDFMDAITNNIQPVKAVNRVNNNDMIYDLQGRRIQGEPQKGLYIQNGKKILR